MDTFVQTLKENNYKVTLQRIAIYEILKNTKEHPNAETIYNKLCEKYPSISLATVYKCLDLFENLNLIKAINVTENSFRYDVNTCSHPHIICCKCKKVEDLHEEEVFNLTTQAEEITNYDIKKQELIFYGKCPDCK